MKRIFFIFLLPLGCLSQVLPVGDPGEEIDAGKTEDSIVNSEVLDSNIFIVDSCDDSCKDSRESDSLKPNYFNCNGDPCIVGSQYCCWFEITSWHCVSSLDGGVCKYQKTCGGADDCASGHKCCLEIATGGQLCKMNCIAGEEKEL